MEGSPEKTWLVLLAVVIPAALLAIPIVLMLNHQRRTRAFEEARRALGGSEIDAGPYRVRVDLTVGGKNQPPALCLSLGRATVGGETILLRRETARDRLGKSLGLNREVELGDDGFDAAIYIESDAPDAEVRALLAREEVRRAVVEIISLGYTDVAVSPPTAALLARRNNPKEVHLTPAAIRRVAALLAVIAPALPARAEAPRDEPIAILIARVVGVLVLLVAGFAGAPLASFAHARWPTFTLAPYWQGIPAAFGLFVVAVVAAALRFRGRSTSFRNLCWLAAALAYAVPSYTMAAAFTLNGALDGTPPVHRASRVLSSFFTTGKKPAHHLRLAPFPGSEGELELALEPDAYPHLAEGRTVTVKVATGALGWPWIQSIDPDR